MLSLQELLQKADSYKQTISSDQLAAADGRSLENYYEAAGQGAAWTYMLELAAQPDLDITEDMIRHLHRLLYQNIHAGQAGSYRTIPVSISGTAYAPPAPEDVPHLMQHLTAQIHYSHTTLHPVELAAMAHKRLLDIHPFIDGNRRTAWLLMNLILVHNGYSAITFSPDRGNDYMDALSASRSRNDMEPFSKITAAYVIEAEQDICR